MGVAYKNLSVKSAFSQSRSGLDSEHRALCMDWNLNNKDRIRPINWMLDSERTQWLFVSKVDLYVAVQ